MALNLEQINADVERWGNNASHQLQTTGAAMNIQHRANSPSAKPSLQQIVARFKYSQGLVHIVSFRIPRQLIYVHKGAGKGMGGSSGSSWADKYGNQHTTDPKSFGKMGSAGRQSKPFFDNTMEGPEGLTVLGDIVLTSIGDAIINNLLIK